MKRHLLVTVLVLTAAFALGGCNREQSDWEKAHNDNTAESYELFVKKYPSGTFTAQAQARLKEIEEERDWQKARDADTVEAYQAFLKEYPEGKWTEEARIRVENFNLAQAPSGTPAPTSSETAASAAETPPGEAGSPPASSEPATIPRAAPTKKPPAKTAAGAAPRGVVTRPGDVSPRSAATAKAGSGYVIQLGAFKSGAKAANRRWAVLAKKYPALLKGLTPSVVQTKTQAGALYRLQVTGLARPAADHICKGLAKHQEPCVLLPKAHR
jgi:cell division septation protein DedD